MKNKEKKKMGRKPREKNISDRRIAFRLTAEEYKKLEDIFNKLAFDSMSEFCRYKLLGHL